MSGHALVERLKYEQAHVDSLGDDRWDEIIALCTTAYQYPDFELLLRLYPDTTHILARLGDQLVSHACWVTRWLQPGDHKPLRTAYIEAVATDPSHQRRGFGSAVMERIATAIADYELAALSTGSQSFYERLGWERWTGPLAVRTDDGLQPTPQDDAMVLRLAQTPQLDLTWPLSAEWREGELW